MNRITEKQLQSMVDRLNQAMGTPAKPYEKDATGKHVAQIGNYHLSHAYGGCTVHQMVNAGGGVRHACGLYGHVPKREVYNALAGALAVLSDVKESA